MMQNIITVAAAVCLMALALFFLSLTFNIILGDPCDCRIKKAQRLPAQATIQSQKPESYQEKWLVA